MAGIVIDELARRGDRSSHAADLLGLVRQSRKMAGRTDRIRLEKSGERPDSPDFRDGYFPPNPSRSGWASKPRMISEQISPLRLTCCSNATCRNCSWSSAGSRNSVRVNFVMIFLSPLHYAPFARDPQRLFQHRGDSRCISGHNEPPQRNNPLSGRISDSIYSSGSFWVSPCFPPPARNPPGSGCCVGYPISKLVSGSGASARGKNPRAIPQVAQRLQAVRSPKPVSSISMIVRVSPHFSQFIFVLLPFRASRV